jgi:hypothetical protein
MRRKIGIRELKNELTDIIRRVGEERVEYTSHWIANRRVEGVTWSR